MSEIKKFLDKEGIEYLWSKISMEDYPNNETLIAVLNAIDETKADKEEVPSKISQLENDSNLMTKEQADALFETLQSDLTLRFYCVEDVTIVTNGISKTYPANSNVEVKFVDTDVFEIIPTSDNSILQLNGYPGALGTYYSWLEGVKQFSNILFDMNNVDFYSKWSQGNQGMYQVQFAQYINCIFWSDNSYVSDVTKRTNYTLYYSSQLPLCYSTIPDNTFKTFFLAFGVNSDPNWGNLAYRESFAKATWATQAFSYYGARTVGIFGHDSDDFNIVLPKDCRGLMCESTAIENAGTFDAINVTNFGAKSGSWRDAFRMCSSLKNLYIKNLKVNLNVSWSPINYESISYIISAAANTNAITISVSPYTYYLLQDSDFELAASKNITIELITTNYVEDRRLSNIANKADITYVDEKVAELSDVALTGSWNELLDKPFEDYTASVSNTLNFTDIDTFPILSGIVVYRKASQINPFLNFDLNQNANYEFSAKKIDGSIIHGRGLCRPFIYNEHLAIGNKELLEEQPSVFNHYDFFYGYINNGYYLIVSQEREYTEALVSISTSDIKTLEEKFIPVEIARQTEIENTNLQLNEIKNSLSTIAISGSWNDLNDKPFGEELNFTLLSEGNVIAEENNAEVPIRANSDYLSSSTEEYYYVQWNDTLYKTVYNSFHWGIGNAYLIDSTEQNTGEPFFIHQGLSPKYTAFIIEEAGSYDFKIYTGQINIKTLDEQFIPDTIARTTDIPDIPEVTTSDNGKVLGVVEGSVGLMEVPSELPENPGNYKSLVTDGNGNWVPADRLAWKESKVESKTLYHFTKNAIGPTSTLMYSDNLIPDCVVGNTYHVECPQLGVDEVVVCDSFELKSPRLLIEGKLSIYYDFMDQATSFHNEVGPYEEGGSYDFIISEQAEVETTYPIPAEYITGVPLTDADNGKVVGVVEGALGLVELQTETWTFTLADGSVVTKTVVVK